MSKKIELSSGTVLTRDPGGGYDEIWKIENKAMATIKVTLDMSSCYGCEVEGHEGKIHCTESAGPLEEKILFIIRRSPPFKFNVKISAIEEPISLEKQDEFIKDKKSLLTEELEKMQEFIESIPFEVMKPKDIIAKIHEFGFDHFIDPSFPPNDRGIFCSEQGGKYPLKEKPVWKRPIEFMESKPQLFLGGIDPNDINQGALGD